MFLSFQAYIRRTADISRQALASPRSGLPWYGNAHAGRTLKKPVPLRIKARGIYMYVCSNSTTFYLHALNNYSHPEMNRCTTYFSLPVMLKSTAYNSVVCSEPVSVTVTAYRVPIVERSTSRSSPIRPNGSHTPGVPLVTHTQPT